MKKDDLTVEIDAGGRYGLHPSWKPFDANLLYYLFEPDKQECNRLKKKYLNRTKNIKIVNKALSENTGEIIINYFKNRAMSSSARRNPISALFNEGSGREEEILITSSEKVKAISIDEFSAKQKIDIDFLKLDTEGSEYDILRGADSQLKNILGVRCEVSFDNIFSGKPGFGSIHDFMMSKNFFLLNLDYAGWGGLSE